MERPSWDLLSKRWPWVALIAVLTCGVFAFSIGFGFVAYDDDLYVYDNHRVLSGLSLEGVLWAFREPHIGHYHPLTWLSHMADVSVFGRQAGGHRAINLLLHVLTSVFLFLFLHRATGTVRRSGLATLLFALHPLHVEPVVWVASRKDVLSTLFFVLALFAYTRHAESPSWRRMATVTVPFALGLLAKPMVITLPAFLLVLDFWPFRRTRSTTALVAEKWPLFLLAAASASMTFYSATTIGVMNARHTVLSHRLATSALNYVAYAVKFALPVDLSVHYPLVDAPHDPVLVAGALCLLALATFAALRMRKTAPYLLVGWVGFVVTLLPVVGIFELGAHVRADRYAYIPTIGLGIALVWGVADGLVRSSTGPWVERTLGSAAIVTYCLLSALQVSYWRDSETLFRHALSVVPKSARMHNLLGRELAKSGNAASAAEHFMEAIQLRPTYVKPRNNLGVLLWRTGNVDEAIGIYRQALAIAPDHAMSHANLALALRSRGDLDEARVHYEKAVALDENYESALVGLAQILEQQGHPDEALPYLERARLAKSAIEP